MGEIQDKIAGADDLRRETWHSDKWDIDIEVRTMTLKNRTNYVLSISDKKGKINQEKFGAGLAASCSFEPGTDNLVFESVEKGIEILNAKSGEEAESLIKLAMRLNGFTGDVEAEVKNA